MCLKDVCSVGGYARGTVRAQAIRLANKRLNFTVKSLSFTISASVCASYIGPKSSSGSTLRSRSIERGFPFAKSKRLQRRLVAVRPGWLFERLLEVPPAAD